MADFCGQCIHIEWGNKERYSSKEKYWCDLKRKYVEPTERICNDRDFACNKSSSSNNSGDYKPSGCFITLIVRDILGYSDDCELLSLMRDLREKVMKKDENKIPLLLAYDQLSPLIAENIAKEEDRSKLCLELLQRFLVPCAKATKEENNEEAVDTYANFFEFLKEKFGLASCEIDLSVEYNMETLGKGRIRQFPGLPKLSEA